MILLLYQLAFPLAGIFLAIRFLLAGRAASLREGAGDLRQRFGRLSPEELSLLGAGPTLWVHAASLGEVSAAAPLLDRLRQRLATAGLFSVTGKEVDLVIVAAFLAIAGYSINDTIVIFDRMREKLRIQRREPMSVIINDSINEMLARTLITNANVIMVVLVLFIFGGQVIHDFALAMLFGGFVGTYSTVAVATPLVYEWEVTRTGRRSEPSPAPSKPEATGPLPPPNPGGKKKPQHRR